MPPLRVLIADDHQLFAESLGLTLDFDERVEVAGSARNGKEAVRLALELQPDAVVMDLDMPVLDGIHATRLSESRVRPRVSANSWWSSAIRTRSGGMRFLLWWTPLRGSGGGETCAYFAKIPLSGTRRQHARLR